MKKIFLFLIILLCYSCNKSIYGNYIFKSDYSIHKLKLKKDSTYVYYINEHLLGQNEFQGNYTVKNKIVEIEKKSNNKSKILDSTYNQEKCITVIDNWEKNITGITLKINDSLIIKENKKGKFCYNKKVFKVQVLEEYEESFIEDYGVFYPKEINSGFTIFIDYKSNDFFIKNTPSKFQIIGRKVYVLFNDTIKNVNWYMKKR
jgi:hypothetical protein